MRFFDPIMNERSFIINQLREKSEGNVMNKKSRNLAVRFRSGTTAVCITGLLLAACGTTGDDRSVVSAFDSGAAAPAHQIDATGSDNAARPMAIRNSNAPSLGFIRKGASLINMLAIRPATRPFESLGQFVSLTKSTVRRIIGPAIFPSAAPKGPPVLNPGGGMDLAAFEAELDRLTGREADYGQISFLVNGEAYFSALERAISRAERSIDIRTYIFDNDDIAIRIADLLRKRSAHAPVRVIVDGMGTYGGSLAASDSLPGEHRGPKSIERYLEKGTSVRFRTQANPWFTGDHSKALIFDNRLAFVGGMNIGREYRHDWHDLMAAVSGPVVERLSNDFSAAWSRASLLGGLGAIFRKDRIGTRPRGEGDYALRVLYTKPADPEIYRAFLLAIERAQSRIYIENAYLADNRILRGLIRARQRGVDTRVILPSRNDSSIMHKSNMITANALLKHGIRVYFYPGMTHVKAAVFDGWASVGSANFDRLSLEINREVNVATSHPEAVERLVEELFRKDFAVSNEMTEPVETGVGHRVAELIANQL